MQRRMKKNQYGSLVSVASIDSVLSAENSDTSRKDKKYISFYISLLSPIFFSNRTSLISL